MSSTNHEKEGWSAIFRLVACPQTGNRRRQVAIYLCAFVEHISVSLRKKPKNISIILIKKKIASQLGWQIILKCKVMHHFTQIFVKLEKEFLQFSHLPCTLQLVDLRQLNGNRTLPTFFEGICFWNFVLLSLLWLCAVHSTLLAFPTNSLCTYYLCRILSYTLCSFYFLLFRLFRPHRTK